MAKSKNDSVYYFTPVRTLHHPIRGHFEAIVYILDPTTHRPYTKAALSRRLRRAVEENPIHKYVAEKWLGELEPLGENSEKTLFAKYCSGSTVKDALARADAMCRGELSSLLRLLGRNSWKQHTRAGTVKIRDYLEFLGDDFYRGIAIGSVPGLTSATKNILLPVLGDISLRQFDKVQQKRISDRINTQLSKNKASSTVVDNCRRALRMLGDSIRSNGGVLMGDVEVMCANLYRVRSNHTDLRRASIPSHLDESKRLALFRKLNGMDCPRLLFIVSLLYCGMSPAEILAVNLDEIHRAWIHGEPVYSYLVDKYYRSEGESDYLMRVSDNRFPICVMRRIVLSPLAAAALERYRNWLAHCKKVETSNKLRAIPGQKQQRISELKKELDVLMESVGIKNPRYPLERGGKITVEEISARVQILLYDAQWILLEVCGADLAMYNTSFGRAAQTTDETNYLDRFSDLYALTRYYHLARFSPFSNSFVSAKQELHSLSTPPTLLTASQWCIRNTSDRPRNLRISSRFPVQITARM